jgi:hypothetical protein
MGDSSMTEIEFRAEALKLLCPNGFGDNGVEINLPDGSSDTVPSQEQLDTKIAELKSDFNSKQYQRDRAVAYPSIRDQLDMQYHDAIDGTTTWKDAIAKVKSDHPKPE